MLFSSFILLNKCFGLLINKIGLVGRLKISNRLCERRTADAAADLPAPAGTRPGAAHRC